jgi:beta-phosphoglucomutase-like phosphatase (HAD superfamily)
VLGLPDGTRGCLFDLDGVITKTAKVHNAAWKEMFDSYLRDRSRRTGEPFVPFDPVKDYCRDILVAVGIGDLFEARIDGLVARREHLRGKPAPDTFLAGARAPGLEAQEAAVFEDALAGVEAGRAGGFRFVVGIDRAGQADALREHGADIVVDDLAELLDHS